MERSRHDGRRRRSVDDGGAEPWSVGDGDADADAYAYADADADAYADAYADGGVSVSLDVGSGQRPGIQVAPSRAAFTEPVGGSADP